MIELLLADVQARGWRVHSWFQHHGGRWQCELRAADHSVYGPIGYGPSAAEALLQAMDLFEAQPPASRPQTGSPETELRAEDLL